jgi:hypothetical protein
MNVKKRLAVAVAVLGGLAVVPTVAGAHWYNNQYTSYKDAHIEVGTHWFLNEVDQSSAARSNTRDAQIEWHNDTPLDLSSTSNHDTSRFHVVDNYYGNTGWVGQGEYCYHCGHLHTRLNLSYSSGSSRTVACQEIGHNVGADHAAGDCMGYSYFSDWSPYVESHSIDQTRSVYRHVFGY